MFNALNVTVRNPLEPYLLHSAESFRKETRVQRVEHRLPNEEDR